MKISPASLSRPGHSRGEQDYSGSLEKMKRKYYPLPALNPGYIEKLNILCAKYKIPLNHHDALSDALACAKLFMLHSSNKM